MAKLKEVKLVTKAVDFNGCLASFHDGYKVYPDLTKKLDALEGKFSAQTINEIVLWKVSRYVKLPEDVLNGLDDVRNLKPGEHEQASGLIIALQNQKGVQIAMASTFLRFANPMVFQILDNHAFRALYGVKLSTCLKTTKTVEAKTTLYLKYLDDLRLMCQAKDIRFHNADRILFEFDKQVNPPLKNDDLEQASVLNNPEF